MIAELHATPSPLGDGTSQYAHVDAVIAVIAASGLKTTVGALGTTIEGPADTVWATIRAAFDAAILSGATENLMAVKVYQGDGTEATLVASGQMAAARGAAPPAPPALQQAVATPARAPPASPAAKAAAVAGAIELDLRSSALVSDAAGRQQWHETVTAAQLSPPSTALLLCDVWKCVDLSCLPSCRTCTCTCMWAFI